MFKKFSLAAAALAASAVAVPAAADAHRIGRAHSHSYDQGYYGQNSYDERSYRRCSGTTGTILGAAAGALLGRAVDRNGSRVTGTVAGGAAGALLGREVAKGRCRR
jgi:hypothetical protein